MLTADLLTVADLLRDAAQVEILPRFRNLAEGAVKMKTGPLDLVTEADEAAERRITDGLRRAFPGCVVVGEEAASATPALLKDLAGADLAFVVDLVDGTANFAAGLALFGVMAAVFRKGEIVGAVIHDPIGDDHALALRGQGAWIETPDGKRRDLRVAAPVPMAAMSGNVSWRFMPEAQRPAVCARLPRLAACWDYRCSAHAYRMTAGGHGHFLFYYRLYPWDHAPGWLLHREAGGYSATFDGRDYDPADIYSGLICAPDRAGWEAVRSALLED
jgi:fructose-1,6-bisphosphatase/inositol monophosphatase family enzyme